MSEIKDGKLLSELVKDAEFTFARRIQTSKFDAAHSVADIQEAARLAAFAINSEWMAKCCLGTEAIENSAEDFVIVKTVDQCFIQCNFVRHVSIHNTLIQIGSARAPDSTGEHHVVAVVHL